MNNNMLMGVNPLILYSKNSFDRVSFYKSSTEQVNIKLRYGDQGKLGAVILTGVNIPTDDYDAANKKYVDDSIKTAIDDSWAASY